MKKIIIVVLFVIIFFNACEDPETIPDFTGTWKGINQYTPLYDYYDVVGVFTETTFELLYYDPNGGTVLRSYSSRGTFGNYPEEGETIVLNQQYQYNEDTQLWSESISTLYAQYVLDNDKVVMTVDIDVDDPFDGWDYEWILTRQ